MKSTVQCEFCKKEFKRNYIKKHQSTAKFCIKIQENNKKISNIEDNLPNKANKIIENLDFKKNKKILSNQKLIKLQKEKKKIESQIQNMEIYRSYLKKIEAILCDYLSLTLMDKEVKKDNISFVILDLMKLINNYKIKGIDKKNIILSVSQKVINNIPFVSSDIKTYINTFLPYLIDTFISVSKNKLEENSSFPIPICI
jgi:hypothetical protein